MKDIIKQQAAVLRNILAERGVEVSQSVALDSISRLLGVRDWNVLAAQLKAEAASRKKYKLTVSGTFQIEEDDTTYDIDVTAWFAQASEEEIQDLHDENYAESTQTTEILDYLVDLGQSDAVAANEAHCMANRLFPGADVGFDFVINKQQALAWLKKYRPKLARQLGDSQD